MTSAAPAPLRTRLTFLARTPPPVHGESVMVRRTLDVLRGLEKECPAFRCFHVQYRLSQTQDEVGSSGLGKIARLLGAVVRAAALSVFRGARTLYYVPAAPSRSGLRRDLVALCCCRPFYPRLILHWHSNGLGEWIARHASPWEKALARRAFAGHDLSILLTGQNAADASLFQPRRVEIVPNGCPDPCPGFDADVLPQRAARLARRRDPASGEPFHILYLGLCTASKGLFCALEAARLVAERGRPVVLDIAGEFGDADEEARFLREAERAGTGTGPGSLRVRRHGLAHGPAKDNLLRRADALCFPTRYPAENMPLVVIEALAWGVPIVATAWRGIPGMLPPGTATAREQSPAEIAALLEATAGTDVFQSLRDHYLGHYTLPRFAARLRHCLN